MGPLLLPRRCPCRPSIIRRCPCGGDPAGGGAGVSSYFFFKENCSYDLLFVLEIEAQEARLTDRFRLFTIPIDTVKAVRAESLISEPAFRPSQGRKIRHIASSLSDADVGRTVSLGLHYNEGKFSANFYF